MARKWGQDKYDIAQELFIYCLEKQIDLGRYDRPTDEEIETDEWKEEYRKVKNALWWHGMKVCDREKRKAKAFREGYNPDDEYFYSIRQIESLLEHFYAAGIEERPPAAYGESLRRSVDASEGGNYLASMVDLSRGLDLVTEAYRTRLALRYGPLAGLSDEAVAALSAEKWVGLVGEAYTEARADLGLTGHGIRHRVGTALRSLQKALGGPSPWRAA